LTVEEEEEEEEEKRREVGWTRRDGSCGLGLVVGGWWLVVGGACVDGEREVRTRRGEEEERRG
jgi:hypothetical protein